MTEQKHRKRTGIIRIILLAAAAVFILTVVFAMKTRRQEQDTRYFWFSDRESYGLSLYGDGTFGLGDLSSSTLTPVDKQNRYYWSDGMLVLDFADSDRKLYFETAGDDLVYRESVSVPLEEDPITDGAVFEKITK